MNLTVGILAIGSLYWDNGVREEWRQSRLKGNTVFPVAVPIRYGRKSNQRKNTYTMVFSPDLEEFGKAKVVECLNVVFSVSCLICEAELLWGAERKELPNGTLSKGWGCVALLANPQRKIPEKVIDEWARRVSQEPNYHSLASSRGSSVNNHGFLQIEWPKLVDGGSLTLDLLLATANDPDLQGDPPDYPSPAAIADAWRQASDSHPSEHCVDYFWNNKKHGIITFQDDAIERALIARGISRPEEFVG